MLHHRMQISATTRMLYTLYTKMKICCPRNGKALAFTGPRSETASCHGRCLGGWGGMKVEIIHVRPLDDVLHTLFRRDTLVEARHQGPLHVGIMQRAIRVPLRARGRVVRAVKDQPGLLAATKVDHRRTVAGGSIAPLVSQVDVRCDQLRLARVQQRGASHVAGCAELACHEAEGLAFRVVGVLLQRVLAQLAEQVVALRRTAKIGTGTAGRRFSRHARRWQCGRGAAA